VPKLIVTTLLFSLSLWLHAQKVGVVLSGGGANGLAHVGVLKALEENSIPIDFITGTSIGALVGGMYAAGYSPAHIENIITSEEFLRSAKGDIETKYVYFFRKSAPNASWFSIRANSDSNLLMSSIPTSFINPAALDLDLMFLLDPASQRCGYNFDSLFIPFRCVASNIEDKKSVIFSSGNLNTAVRASMSYPLYLKPLKVEGKLLFDGGLYNNFPTDIMRDIFAPEVIIGSNVSGNEDPPQEDDFISQLRNMVVSQTNYELLGDCCVLIEPKVNHSTFDFDHQQESIDSGYVSTLRKMDEIKQKVNRRVHPKVVQENRLEFNRTKKELVFDKFEYLGLNKAQSTYVNRILKTKGSGTVKKADMKKGYFRLYESDNIDRLFPFTSAGLTDSTFTLHMEVKKEKELVVEFGGNISSRPINTGYLGVGYTTMNRTGMSYYTNTYFGKLYASVLAMARIDIPTRFPIYLEPLICINRWNYFKSRATFFEDNNSLFLIQNEQYARLDAVFALSNKVKGTLGGSIVSLRDDYYQVINFGEDDNTDKTTFGGSTFYARLEKSSLNKKLYANAGSALMIALQYNQGLENYTPGSTSSNQFNLQKLHSWVDAKTSYDHYYKQHGKIRLGIYAEAVFSNMELFTNYTASSLRSPSFQPTPESKTLFLESFRAYQYAALGQKIIFNVYKNVDLRVEGYIFQPYRFAVNAETNFVNDIGEVQSVFKPELRTNIERRYTLATANLVYHSPLGPLSASVNYYFNVPELLNSDVNPRTPITLLVHFGYILFNDRALR